MKVLFPVIFYVFTLHATPAQQAEPHSEGDSIMITVMMKHHQDKNIDELREIREKNRFLELFPPESAKVVSWYVMMGIGQVVTVKIPASELRNLNIAVERGVWGAFSTEFYPTYDLYPHIQEEKNKLKNSP
ncbi:hypothetical protein [Pleomorphovibrio marinus]|uniref:hypothetical protein n=1 Tax=Pleomorphovibrio marinus TaxID=2164132 RepID=UPI001E5173E7|nr:hypothetical protein [Pleomorphovibrio marinus]